MITIFFYLKSATIESTTSTPSGTIFSSIHNTTNIRIGLLPVMDFKGALLKGLDEIPLSSTISPPVVIEEKLDEIPLSSTISPPVVIEEKPSLFPKITIKKPVFHRHPLMGFTENNSATYLSSGNPCLDFFFHVVPDTPSSQLVDRLELSWAHDPLTTLKLICNLRGVRGTGKQDKEGFYTAALWLYEHHPRSLANNVEVFTSFGYFKDLLEIMFRLLQGPDARSILKKEWESKKSAKRRAKLVRALRKRGLGRGFYLRSQRKKHTERKKRADYKFHLLYISQMKAQLSQEVRIKVNNIKTLHDKRKASNLRKQKQFERSEKAIKMYNTDLNYQLLHEHVSTLFADMLKADMESLNLGKTSNISLAGKWCPTIDSSYDKYTLICASIAKKVFPRESYPEYEGIEEAHYVFRVRDRLRKQVLVPLHRALELPEIYMSAKEWSLIPYNRVSSVAMKNYTNIFGKHDKERFDEYLQNVKKGEAKIAAGALLPHDIIESCLNDETEEQKTVAELQWKRMVDDMLKNGRLTNCIAVSDVSGSMSGIPMEVSVALGLLVSELSEEPWKGHVITFSQYPQLHLIEGNSLLEKSEFIREMNWGGYTDFQKVFDEILKVAVAAKLSEDQMIKTVFVFSDMEFNEASPNPWETDYMVIQKKFKKKGYKRVPNIVFWNLRNSSATPVTATEDGVAMLSGYSKNFLTLFLRRGGVINPEFMLEAVISGDEYQKLVVYD